MGQRRALWLSALLFMAALLRLLIPGTAETLRAWTEDCFAPGAEETVEAWGRALAGQEEWIAAMHQEGGP